ncbi:BTAD domain-containing putative transcriptional regulator [Micromonospora sp. C95]|uniref:BTAD domain-containing putative transcriptional regulator n=1 Tax=Micromonospora sp. C95 TaxID=2824882 RepID=UPI001B35FEB3|nr:BTAD domain-containing putative transcriptional regulator [Micromonospora sp. C95]MBQ1022768.1 LysM peptidoglycan-binding domain-containing protein [Micromonospora sp. C95]
MKSPVSAALVAVVVLAAAPLVLLYLAAWPAPTMPSGSQLRAWLQQPLTTGFLTTLLQTSAWLLWAMFTATIVRHVYRAVAARLRWRIALRMPGPMQGLTAALLGATAVTSTALPAADQATATTDTTPGSPPGEDSLPARSDADRSASDRVGAGGPSPRNTGHGAGGQENAARHGTAISASVVRAPSGASAATRLTVSHGDSAAPRPAHTCVVRDGDTLSAIAHRWLGDPDRWPEIWALNRGARFDTVGGTFTNPDLIYPGWILDLPADAAPPGAAGPTPAVPSQPDPPHTQEPPVPAEPTGMPSPGEGSDTPPNPTTATPAPPTAGNLPSDHATATPAPTNSSSDESCGPGITLGTGSWLDLGLALAIAAATTVVWRLRRRRYTPRPPSADSRVDDPDLTPLPDVVTRIRRGLRTPTPDTGDRLHDLLDDTDEVDDDAFTDTDLPEDDLPDHAGQPEPTDAPPPNLPALGNPMLTAWPPAGLGLTGPGAPAAARGFLAAALAAGGVDDPHGRGSVVLPAATLATLLGAAVVNVPATPRLTVTADLTEALELLEEQTLHRTRLVHGHEVDTVAHLRIADPSEEPLPPILLLADATGPPERTRIAALLAQGQRLDIHGVLLGAWPDGNTVVVAGDGTTTPTGGEGSRHGSHPAEVGRLAVITAAEAAALLPTLAESHTGLPQPPAPTEPRPPTRVATTPPATPTDDHDDPTAGTSPTPEPDATTPDQLADATSVPDTTVAPTAVASTTSTNTAATAGPRPDGEDGQNPNDGDDGAAGGDGPGVVAVRVLGQPRIVGADPDQPLRAKAMELLVYLIVRDGGATVDAMKEDLVPDATVSKAPHRIHTYVYALRQALKRTGGAATYITHPRHRYQLNRDALDVDLWRMRQALAAAETATGDARVAALRQAVAAYHGPFADGTRYEWAEPYREAVRRQALDAHLALADALCEQPEEALTVLNAAIAHDPYAEQVYQAAMRRHADLDDADAIAARLAELTRRLEELDTEPTDGTIELASALIDDVRRRARRNPGAAA